MRVFGKYCGKMQKKLDLEGETLKTILNQNVEKEDEAHRVYDSMANTDTIRHCLRSID
jgi:hypothetical protein